MVLDSLSALCFCALFIYLYLLQKSLVDQHRQGRLDDIALLQTLFNRYVEAVQTLVQNSAQHPEEATDLDFEDDDDDEVD